MKALISRIAQRAFPSRLRQLLPDHVIASRAFDVAFYLEANPDVAEAGADALDHFMAHGWREGRDPSAEFSTGAYLAAFPEVAAAGVNPFVHYLTNGRPHVVREEHPLGFRYEVITGLAPMEARVAAATAGSVAPADPAVLAEALSRARGGLRALHVTFSHDDFTANLGGVQLVIQLEAARLAAEGRDHLHLYPSAPWPVVRTAEEPETLGVVWNGRRIGAVAPAAVARALAAAAGTGSAEARSFAIHSLLGHAADETADILAAAGLSEGAFWLHDFASLCAGFHLLRNDVEDCAAPPPESAACGVCIYGPWRARHLAEHAQLFQRLGLTVVSPSTTTLELWRRAWDFPTSDAVVRPHAVLVERGPAPEIPADRPFRLAYAGFPTAHKGWPVFRALAVRHADDPRYQFVHLGARQEPQSRIPFHKVTATPDQPLAMQAALEAHQPDAVLVWPLCRETFSFVTYEAAAAGCAVITGPDSGNVAAFVAETGHGRVLQGEAALAAAFDSGEILALGRARRRPMLHDLRFGA